MNNQFIKTQQFEISNNNTSYKLDKDNIQKINIYNSINQIGFIFDIIYNDITDVKSKLPLRGGETLNLHLVQEDGKEVIKELILNKVVTIADKNDITSILKMSFITKEAYYLTVNRDYNYYEDTASNIIKNYIPDLVGSADIPYGIVIPGYSYSKAIQYINTFSGDYLFERTDDFLYSSLDDLLVTSDRTLVFNGKNPMNKDLIQGYKEVSVFNSLSEGSENIYDSINTWYNPDKKSIEQKQILIEDVQRETKTLGAGANYSEEIKENINSKYNVRNYFTGELDDDPSDSLFNKNYEILINGDFNIDVGDTLNVNFRDRFNSDPNQQLNGLWLVTKIMHQIDRREFITKIMVSKNAYFAGEITENTI